MRAGRVRLAAIGVLVGALTAPLVATPVLAADAAADGGTTAATSSALTVTAGDEASPAATPEATAETGGTTSADAGSGGAASEGSASEGSASETAIVETPFTETPLAETPLAEADPAETSAPAADAGSPADTETALPTEGEIDVTGVTFDWGINNESNGGAYFGGCNFLSAGVAGDTGSSRIWSQTDGFYASAEGNTTIVKPSSDGTDLVQPTWSTKCQTPSGTSVNGKTTNAADSYTQTRVQIANGTGTIDVDANTAEISWDGSFSVVYYGGMTYWSVTDPTLVVEADGTGTVTASLSGYAADMDDPSIWNALEPRDVVIAELTDVDVSATGLTVTPDFLGVAVPSGLDGRNPQADRDAENAAYWGAFPEDFLRFQLLTGQDAYWYTTAGGANSIQPRKATLPLTVTVGDSAPAHRAPAIVTQPADATAADGAQATFVVEASGYPLAYQWQHLDRSGSWQPLEGETSAALRITASDETDGAGYRVVVSNELGSVTSERATLTVGDDSAPGGGGTTPAEPVEAEGAVFDWGINNESNGGAYFGGCNFLSAGIAGDAGSSRLWTEADGFYRAQDGNTTIVQPTASGDGVQSPTWATKCQTPQGTSVNGKTNNGSDSYTQTRVRIDNGVGVFDPEANTAEVQWTGSFTVAYYGGMTYWFVSDPKLTVGSDGTGSVTATVSGYGSDMDDASKWEMLAPRTVTLAELKNVTVTASGFTVTPEYLGVSLPDDVSGRNAQAAFSPENAAWWGSFPADFVRFQMVTGQSSYWFTTAGGAGSIQPRKVTLPLTVCATADCTVPSQAAPADSSPSTVLTQNTRKAPTALARPAAQASALVAQEETVVIISRAAAATGTEAVSAQRMLIAATALIVALGLLTIVAAAGGGLFATGVLTGTSPPRRR